MSKDHQTEQKTPIDASETVKANPDIKTPPHLDIQKINELVRVFIIFVKLSIILIALSLLSFIGVLVTTLSVSSRMFSTSSVISTSPVTSSSIAT